MAEPKVKSQQKVETLNDESKIFAALSYVLGLLIAVLLYLFKKEDPFVKYHAIQAILFDVVVSVVSTILIVGAIVIGLVLGVTSGGAGLGLGVILFYAFILLYAVVMFVVRLIFAYKAYTGKRFKIPIIGNQAEKMSQ